MNAKPLDLIWKVPVFLGLLVVGSVAASQLGWTLCQSIVEDHFGNFIDDLILGISVVVIVFSFNFSKRLLPRLHWIAVPVLIYMAVVPGAWNGFASDFDSTRGDILKHGYANGYAIERMSDRGRFLSCRDKRIRLTEDAVAACNKALTVPAGERIPGSEHRCGFLGFLECFDTAPEASPVSSTTK